MKYYDTTPVYRLISLKGVYISLSCLFRELPLCCIMHVESCHFAASFMHRARSKKIVFQILFTCQTRRHRRCCKFLSCFTLPYVTLPCLTSFPLKRQITVNFVTCGRSNVLLQLKFNFLDGIYCCFISELNTMLCNFSDNPLNHADGA